MGEGVIVGEGVTAGKGVLAAVAGGEVGSGRVGVGKTAVGVWLGGAGWAVADGKTVVATATEATGANVGKVSPAVWHAARKIIHSNMVAE